MCKACLCASKLGKWTSPGSEDVTKWRKVVGERGDKVIFFLLDKLDHDLRKTMPRRKFLIWKIWAIWSVGSDKTKCVYSFRQVNSERALYLVEILVIMDDHYPAITKHTLLCALDWWVIFVFLNPHTSLTFTPEIWQICLGTKSVIIGWAAS